MMDIEDNNSRRKFLSATAATAFAVALRPGWAWVAQTMDPRVADIVAKTIAIDTHNHIDVPMTETEAPGADIDLAGEMKRSGLSAICMTFATDYQKGNAYDRFLRAMEAMDRQLKLNGMKRSLSPDQIRTAHSDRQPTVIQAIEGAHFLQGRIERVEEAYRRGMRHFGLLHDSDAEVPLGDVYTNPPRFGGLTEFGASVIKECNRLGMLVDLAHADMSTTRAALKVTTRPVIISHTGLDTQLGNDPTTARMMRPRLISREQAKIVADAGGAIGVWTHLADTPLEFAQNVRALVDVIGADHVCVGTDTKLTPASSHFGGPPSSGSTLAAKPEVNGPSTPGRQQQRLGARTNEAWADEKAGFYYVVVDAMLKTGFNPEEIGKIGGGNYLRLFEGAVQK